jgi:hypothetical protein
VTASRYNSLSAVTRQWITDNYGSLFAQHSDKNRRTGEFMDLMLDAVQAGELPAIEDSAAQFAAGVRPGRR